MNAWQQVQWIASEALNYLQDALIITQLASRDKTADFNVKPNGYAVGSSVNIRTNPMYKAEEFSGAIVIQGIRSSKRSLTIEKHFDVSVEMTAKEKRLDFDGFSTQVILPAAYALAEKSDIYVGTKILQAAGLYQSADPFSTAADMALAKQSATIQQLRPSGRFCLVNDALEAKLLGATYFNTHQQRGETGVKVFNEGEMGRAMGMQFFASLNFPTGTHATADGTSQTDNNSGVNNRVGVSVLTFDSLTGSMNAGDRIKIAGVKRPLITSAAASATDTSVALVDPISEIIPDNAAITLVGASTSFDPVGAIFDDASLAVAMPMLDPPSDKPSFVVSDNGYSIRVVQGYDMDAKVETISLDLLIGSNAYDPRRITLIGDTV